MTMKIQLLLMVLLGVALAAPPTDLKVSGPVIYNDAAMDLDTAQAITIDTTLDTGSCVIQRSYPVLTIPYRMNRNVVLQSPILTFEVRLDTLTVDDALIWEVDGKGHRYGESFTRWNLYVTQTLPDTVRRFRVARLELIEEVP